jgi:hypothetical protein
VDSAILKHDVVDLIIFAAASEAYAIHVSNMDLPVPEQRTVLRYIGNLKELIKLIGPPTVPPDEILRDDGESFIERRNELFRRAELCKDDITQYDIPAMRMVPDPDVFFETMLGMIKNDLVSYQVHARLVANKTVTDLKNRINRIKNSGEDDFNTLFTLEKFLDVLEDTIMRGEVSKHSLFDILNNEKITPHFVNMSKAGKNIDSLAAIKDDNGNAFMNDTCRHRYITNYYRRLYTKENDLPVLNDNSIAEFLGPEICDSSIVKNSKLTEVEQALINTPFSVGELDAAVKEAKSATAGGPDGIGNACIKKIWPYIRIPLTNYANHCLDTGRLTDNFRTASIKLIPKKGDLSRITNWRPISLLNCVYKIISKAINERLKSVSSRILSRAQKGFTKGRYIQECIINIAETIARCNKYKNTGFLTCTVSSQSL